MQRKSARTTIINGKKRYALINRGIGWIACADHESKRDVISRVNNSIHGLNLNVPTEVLKFEWKSVAALFSGFDYSKVNTNLMAKPKQKKISDETMLKLKQTVKEQFSSGERVPWNKGKSVIIKPRLQVMVGKPFKLKDMPLTMIPRMVGEQSAFIH